MLPSSNETEFNKLFVKTPSNGDMSSLHMAVIQCSRQLTESVSILADAQSNIE